MKKFFLSVFVISISLFSLSCSSDDDGDDGDDGGQNNNVFIGSFMVDNINCTFDNGSSGGGMYVITITPSVSGVANEIAIKNLEGQNKVYSATVNGDTYVIDTNPEGATGIGTMQADGNTFSFTYNNPSDNNAMCNGGATRQ